MLEKGIDPIHDRLLNFEPQLTSLQPLPYNAKYGIRRERYNLDDAAWTFNRKTIEDVLGPSFNQNVEWHELFVKILIALQQKNLAAKTAEAFIQRLNLLNYTLPLEPYLKIFGSIVQVYGIITQQEGFHEELKKGKRKLTHDPNTSLVFRVQDTLDALLEPYTKKQDHVISYQIASWLATLIDAQNDHFRSYAAKIIVEMMLTKEGIHEEIIQTFPRMSAPNSTGTAFNCINEALLSCYDTVVERDKQINLPKE